jgi:acyl carrier protein
MSSQAAETAETRLRKVFAEVLNMPEGDVNDGITFDKTKEWDSLAHMSLIAALDSEFDIMLDTDDVVDLSSYAQSKVILRKYEVVI